MAKVISQETFDDVVKENIVEFSMSAAEARQETIDQFEAQDINLSNIIIDLAINEETGQPLLNETIDKLKTHIGEKKSSETKKLLEYLSILDAECQKSIPHRVLAGKNGAHEALITLLQHELATAESSGTPPNAEVLENCLRAVNSLTHHQPDLFDAEALAIVLKLLGLSREQHAQAVCLTLQWLQKACIMHETNRQNIVNAGIVKPLKPFVCNGGAGGGAKTDSDIKLIREVMAVLRFLVLDDDIRVEISSAHEHARQIANEVIVELTQLLREFDDLHVLADILLTIGTLAVRQEFCTTIEEAGGLQLVFDIMTANPNAVRLNREALKLVRALAGNDAVKAHLVLQGVAPIIKELLHTHMANENIATAALACVSTLTLRVKENSVAFFETGIAETIVETMRLHPKNVTVQRNGAWSIRNMVSRSREQCDVWLSYGIEDLLNAAMRDHPTVQQDIKAALRDLGCKVELKEEWTGTAEKKIVKSIK